MATEPTATTPRRRYLLGLALLVLATCLLVMRDVGAPPTPAHGALGRGPTLVLVHGLGSRAQHWLPVARQLAKRFRVVLVGLPGHGMSGMPAPFSLERATQALTQALAAEADRPVVLIGHSIGGLIAAAVAIEHPERVRALVLVETLLAPQTTLDDRQAMLGRLDSGRDELLRSVYISFGRDSAQGLGLYREAAAEDSTNLDRWIRLALTADLSAPAARLRIPVLAVMAPHTWPADETWPVTAAAIGYARIPDVRPVRIERCGHFVMLDQPGELAGVIARFASQLESARR